MNIKYGIIAIDRDVVFSETETVNPLHFVGYEKLPTILDYILLYRELVDDPEFGKETHYLPFILLPASSEMVEHFKNEPGVLHNEEEGHVC